MIVFFFYIFLKRYIVDTHYNHLVDEILICTLSNNFYEEISIEFSDSFCCIPFLLVIGLQKIHRTPQEKKQPTIIYCEVSS